MTSFSEVGRIEYVPLREVWEHEAQSFTPWLLANEDVLSQALGIQLTLTSNERRIGSFSLDIIGENQADGSVVIVENQLERTDHAHLGQVMTYAGGVEPTTVIWVASEFREEHRAALDWLNRVTTEQVHFFGIEVKAIRIGDSAPAPWLDVVVRPNSWTEYTRELAQKASQTAHGLRNREFWQQLVEGLGEEIPEFKGKTVWAWNSLTFATGVGGVVVGLNITRKRMWVDLYLRHFDPEVNDSRFDFLLDRRGRVEEVFGSELAWERLDERKSCRIAFYGDGNLSNVDSWPTYNLWFADVFNRFKAVTQTPEFRDLRHIP